MANTPVANGQPYAPECDVSALPIGYARVRKTGECLPIAWAVPGPKCEDNSDYEYVYATCPRCGREWEHRRPRFYAKDQPTAHSSGKACTCCIRYAVLIKPLARRRARRPRNPKWAID